MVGTSGRYRVYSLRRHELITLPVRWQFAQGRANAVGWEIHRERHDVAAAAYDRQPVARERERIEAVDPVVDFLKRHGGVGLGVQGDVDVSFRAALAGVAEMEIERHRIEELKLLVVLEQVALLDPVVRCRVSGERRLETGLTRLL